MKMMHRCNNGTYDVMDDHWISQCFCVGKVWIIKTIRSNRTNKEQTNKKRLIFKK